MAVEAGEKADSISGSCLAVHDFVGDRIVAKRQNSASTSSSLSNASRNSAYPEALTRLMDELARLPGIGRRSAERLAFYLLKSEKETALRLSRAISDVKTQVRHCRICYNFSDGDTCAICNDVTRDHGTILIVEQPKDLMSLEQTGMYHGNYHVLMGHLAPLEGVEPSDLTVGPLMTRIDDPARHNAQGAPVREIIFGLSPNLEGDTTALYIADLLKSRPNVKTSRLARGLPSGSQIEYANRAVLADAIIGRQGMEPSG